MKKLRHIFIFAVLMAASTMVANGQENRTATGGGSQGPVLKYGSDIIIQPMSGVDQANVKLAIAFNGWLYSAYTIYDAGTTNSTGMIRRSKDNGQTWTEIDSYTISGGQRYYDYEIVVAGTDTNSLTLYVAGLRMNSASNYVLFIDEYNATTGVITIGGAYSDSRPNKIYDVAMATDYRWPAFSASPYSVAALYSVNYPTDSLLMTVSVDGGTTFNAHTTIANTSSWFGKVSLAYGRGWNYSNGRYFVAYEKRNGYNATLGSIYTTHQQSTITGNFVAPKCLDSIEMTYVFGKVRNPRICTQFNDTDNDSSNVTAVVLMDRAYTGPGDFDVIGYYNKQAVSSHYWHRFDINNTGSNSIQGDVKYDPTYNNFLVTYFDSTNQTLPYLVQGYNLLTPFGWTTLSSQYNDAAGMGAPNPIVEINPLVNQVAFVWSAGTTGSGVATFDGEYLTTGIENNNSIAISGQLIFPNPVTNIAYLNFTIDGDQRVIAEIYSLTGQKVLDVTNQNYTSGQYSLNFDASNLNAGFYLCKIQTGSMQKTIKFSVVR